MHRIQYSKRNQLLASPESFLLVDAAETGISV
jgi:hypothetical protein